MTLAGEQPVRVRCELTAPDGASVWEFGPAEAESGIAGPAGDFCRIAARARAGFVAAAGHRAARRYGAAADAHLRGIGGWTLYETIGYAILRRGWETGTVPRPDWDDEPVLHVG